MKTQKDYKLEIGNSSNGTIGLVAYTRATDKRKARQYFKDILLNQLGDGDATIPIRTGRYYVNVHIGAAAFNMSNITEEICP